MKMPEFLDWQTFALAIIAFSVVILSSWSQYNSTKKSEEKINNHTSKESLETRKYTEKLFESIKNDDFIEALKIFNQGDLATKKAIIGDLKTKAIDNSKIRQKVINFLSALNDWVIEDGEYADTLLSPNLEWGRWFLYKSKYLIKKDDKVFEKEKQILSMESSQAIYEIIVVHTLNPQTNVLYFENKNLLGMIFIEIDFKNRNINFTGANFFGIQFIDIKNINNTEFQYVNYYGETVFRDMSLPKNIYILGELGTHYHGDMTFLNVVFPYGAGFYMAYFPGKLIINSSVFKDEASFLSTHFKGSVQFHRCRFEKGAFFTSADFYQKTIIEISEFLGETSFVTVKFLDEVTFKDTTFKINPKFNGTEMENIKNLELNE